MAIDTEKHEHTIIITLNRPEARNAVNGAVARGLEAALDEFETDDQIWVGILAAAGPVFCAGADLKEIASGNSASLGTARGGFGGLTRRKRIKPLIAAVTGAAVAGGCELVLSCDMVVAAQTAVFGLPEVKRSLVAAAGGLFRLPRAIGMAPAMEVILTGEPISAQRAFELGLVNSVVTADKVLEESLNLANRITANAPLAVQASRNIAAEALLSDDETLWKSSNDAMRMLSKTEDYKEGPRAFIEKRTPKWQAK